VNILLQIRSMAMEHPDSLAREALKAAANDLESAIRLLYVDANEDNMRTVNCMWARGQRLLESGGHPSSSPTGGRLPIPKDMTDDIQEFQEAA
jgi:hypothetical protein